jgi:hypothetical protein
MGARYVRRGEAADYPPPAHIVFCELGLCLRICIGAAHYADDILLSTLEEVEDDGSK